MLFYQLDRAVRLRKRNTGKRFDGHDSKRSLKKKDTIVKVYVFKSIYFFFVTNIFIKNLRKRSEPETIVQIMKSVTKKQVLGEPFC